MRLLNRERWQVNAWADPRMWGWAWARPWGATGWTPVLTFWQVGPLRVSRHERAFTPLERP